MSKPLSDRLYNLLPAIYRIQDAKPEQGQALRVLMALIERQFLDLEADVVIGQLGDTCTLHCSEHAIVGIRVEGRYRPWRTACRSASHGDSQVR